MTEAAVIEAPQGAPIGEQIDPPTPITNQVPREEKPETPKTPEQARSDAVRKAVEKVTKAPEPKPEDDAKAEAEAAADAKPEPKKAKPKPPVAEAKPESAKASDTAPSQPPADRSPHHEPPSRLDDAAKAEWSAAPESVKGAVHRAFREMESGIQKHREAAEAFEPLRQFHDLARQGGTDLQTALSRYVGLEQELRRDPIAGLEIVVQNLGLKGPNGQPATLRDVAAFVLGQKPDQVASRQEAVIGQLRQQVQQLQQQVGGVTQSMQAQRVSGMAEEVARFSAQPERARFAELQDDMQFFLTSGRISANLPPQERLAMAYELAERINPAPSAPLTPAKTPLDQTQDSPKPLKPAGQKSISGAPGDGVTNPKPQKLDRKEAINKAMRDAGLL